VTDKRAWLVTDPDRNLSECVFATTRGQARMLGLRQLDLERADFCRVSVQRQPIWDRYAEQGHVPNEAWHEESWFGDGEAE